MSGMSSSVSGLSCRGCPEDHVLDLEGNQAILAHGALFATTPDRCFPWWLCTNTSCPRASAVRAIHSPEHHVLDLEGYWAILAFLPRHELAAWVCHRASCCRHPVRHQRRWVQGGFHWTWDAGASQQVQLLVPVAASRGPLHVQEGELAVPDVQVQALHELVVVDMADPDVNVPCVVQAPLQRSPSPNPLHLRIARASVLGAGPEPVPLALQVVCGLGATRQRSDAGHRTQEARLGDTMTERNSTPR